MSVYSRFYFCWYFGSDVSSFTCIGTGSLKEVQSNTSREYTEIEGTPLRLYVLHDT